MNAGPIPARTLPDEISTLYAHINAATFVLIDKIRRFDELQLYAGFNCKSTAHWLNWACGIALGAGREKVRVAHALAGLPLIEAAFRAGSISYSKVRALTRVATPENEATFLEVARDATASQTERIARHHRQALASKTRVVERTLQVRWDADGALVFNGRLTAEQGALFMKAIEHATPADDAAIAERRADALVVLAERTLDAVSGSSSTADRYQVSVHVSAKTLAGALDVDDPPQLEAGPILPVKTAERLTCDASIVPIIESSKGEPLNVGRKTRTVSPALRRALHRRDKGCRFPGCEQVHHVDAHHIHHWAHGGETRLDNLVLLCRYHHRQLHEGGYIIERHKAELHFKDPSGVTIPPTAEDHAAGDVETLVENVPAGTLLHAASLTPEHGTNRPDYRHISWVLAQR